MKEIHEKFIKLCINLAKKGLGKTLPNPLVGCVIVKNGKIIGKGYHKRYGGHHAEVEAINNSTESVEGATLYVNLEPCSHYGKTPPCVDLIINKKINTVVVGMKDPNPLVNGKGIEKLKRNGIKVISGILEEECKKLNEVFIKNIKERKTFLTLKLALTIDGKIAEKNGNSKWITDEKAREFVHKIRFSCDSILVGGNTLRIDNPELTVRKGGKVIKDLYKIIITNRFDFNLDFKVFKNKEKVIFLSNENNKIPEKFRDFKIIKYKKIHQIPEILFKNNIFHTLVEGGSKVCSLFLKSKIIDKLYFFYGNKILGGDSISMIDSNTCFSLENSLTITIERLRKIGNNFMIEGYPKYPKGNE